jgi:hypothetical protein
LKREGTEPIARNQLLLAVAPTAGASTVSQTFERGYLCPSLGIILLVLLVMLLLGALPSWGHSRSWGYGPSGGLGLLLVIVLLLVVFHVI